MRLISLHVENFRSIKLLDLTFPENGLVNLRGESGAGKSSVFHAINYALGGNTIPVKDLQDWGGGAMNVKLVLGGERTVEIVRSPKASSITVDGALISTANKEFEKILSQVLEAPEEFRTVLTYRDQMSPLRFLKLPDTEKKGLLSSLLGLEKFEVELESVTKGISSLENDLVVCRSSLAGIASLLGNKPEAPDFEVKGIEKELELISAAEIKEERLKRAEDTERAEYNAKEIVKLKAQIAEIRARPPLARPKELLDSKKALDTAFVEAIGTRNERIAVAKAAWDSTVSEAKVRPKLVAELEAQERGLAKLKSGVCPFCEQNWSDQSKIVDCEAKIAKIKAKIDRLPNEDQIAALHANYLAEYTSQGPVLDSASVDIDKKLAEWDFKVRQDQHDSQMAVNSLYGEIAKLEADLPRPYISPYANKKAKLKDQMRDISVAKTLYESSLVNWLKIQQAWEAKTLEVEGIQNKLNIELDYQALLKGFLSRIFEEVLSSIAGETNAILALLPNTETVVVGFEAQKASGRESITPVYTFGGVQANLKSGASGGMATAIELAVDLALAKTVSERKGLRYDWLLLDEAFNGFSQTVRESMLTILAQYATTRLVVCVDHAGEMQALFERTWTIKEGQLNEINPPFAG